ncbi:tripartite tricarboxylate transporter TctB family protein [Microvirga pudoricolor]|uniref:tripartite tricarboxylate transporter TctB family protein n=1 Tax=Microvirga pudoricolor TaxID=2778729 RepID=UPI00194FE9CA|nr:tripartite tricarboxylate transporter TctB family protein [Microvirga pudoricolor]MBM6595548.1 tripartite tricarboxylate transporter TctB family protein [Microvirga pudoricolor]
MTRSLNRQIVSGLMFTCIGLFGFWLSRDYDFGKADDMGPGYFPTVLSAGLAILGLVGVIRGLSGGEAFESFNPRPAPFILGSIVLFALTVEMLGFPASAFVSTLVAGFGSPDVRWRSLVILAAGLAVISTLVFVYALGLPFIVFPS